MINGGVYCPLPSRKGRVGQEAKGRLWGLTGTYGTLLDLGSFSASQKARCLRARLWLRK